MKAAMRSRYGPPGVIRISEVEVPVPKGNEVLIRVHATTVNRTDCSILYGRPYMMRLFTGLVTPRFCTTGSDFAGQVEAIGSEVRSFKVGDNVMGFLGVFGCGSHAEYMVLPETKAIVAMPVNLNYRKAVACIEGAYYASVGISRLKPKEGQTALVNGATGAIGSSMIQLLKFYGITITAVCNGENAGLVKILGADKVIDYTMEDFTKNGGKYDYIFDAVGKTSFSRCRRLLNGRGVFVPLDELLFPPPAGIKNSLSFIRDLVENKSFKPVIDREYTIDEINHAYEYVAGGKKIGNVVINIS